MSNNKLLETDDVFTVDLGKDVTLLVDTMEELVVDPGSMILLLSFDKWTRGDAAGGRVVTFIVLLVLPTKLVEPGVEADILVTLTPGSIFMGIALEALLDNEALSLPTLKDCNTDLVLLGVDRLGVATWTSVAD